VSIQLSEDAQQHVAPATTDVKPGNSANSPAHRARAAMETYSANSANSVLGQGPFGQLVSQIARGVFTEPTPDGATVATGDEPAPEGGTVATGDEPAPEGGTVATGDEPAPEGGTVATGDEPAPEGGTVAAGDEPAPEGETVAAGDEPDGTVTGGATESLTAAVEADLIDELLEETTEK
jgi:hypothetical protein